MRVGAGVMRRHLTCGIQDRIPDAPRGAHLVVADEQGRISLDDVTDQRRIGVGEWAVLVGEVEPQLLVMHIDPLARHLHAEPEPEALVGLEADGEHVPVAEALALGVVEQAHG